MPDQPRQKRHGARVVRDGADDFQNPQQAIQPGDGGGARLGREGEAQQLDGQGRVDRGLDAAGDLGRVVEVESDGIGEAFEDQILGDEKGEQVLVAGLRSRAFDQLHCGFKKRRAVRFEQVPHFARSDRGPAREFGR